MSIEQLCEYFKTYLKQHKKEIETLQHISYLLSKSKDFPEEEKLDPALDDEEEEEEQS